jgi:hypothetical protein
VAIAGKWARSKARQRTGCRSGLPWRGQDVGLLAVLDRRQFGRSFVLSIGEAGHEATTAPGGDRRQVGQGEGETAYRLPIGVAVAWSGSRGADNPRLPLAWFVLAALDHRQFGRAFVLSIGEAGHEATTAPASSGAWWRSPASGPGRRRDSVPAADRGCRGLWSWCRAAGNPRLPLAWPVLAVLDHRQFGRAFVLSIGEAGHEATTAPGLPICQPLFHINGPIHLGSTIPPGINDTPFLVSSAIR